MTEPQCAEFLPATLDDLPLLVEMMPGVYDYEGDAPDGVRWAHAATELIRAPSLGRLWVIRWLGKPVGYLSLTFGYSLEFYGRNASIDELFVAAPYRSQGIGRQALEFAEAFARSQGLQALMLEVDIANTRGQRFYEARGFQYYPHMHLMSKQLESVNSEQGPVNSLKRS